ncbi:acyltransferase family protein [Plebeiibacterium sediminum]|uniref:Heparan-alpha-glucosaminide N-acetyltransferase domain-containing protein n=1 Tax=Plebeiibacterium sediminum TaxID=2992112 RepID=A0AAE3M0Q5_9BACT|nr:heparan-alpha-glucosaminide N-acetyltransferase domain-containing protein [Plebeiobacterium sediminum]MCW3784879.1 heparan-alpha-glucosaminide N-acetyltransferase domain-containing protein [Plebeiobacterium sediminum]
MAEVITKKTERFLSLDVFRGLTIALMIVVNTPGTGAKIYAYLIHAQWFGFTLADLVFPSFLFAVGNSLSFSMNKMKQAPAKEVWFKIIKRTVIIFLLGYLMYWFPFFKSAEGGGLMLKPIGETRIMGVLQRIALCYFFASVIFYYLSEKVALILSGIILLGYWAILYLFGEPGAVLEMATNAASKFDLSILGLGHIYKKDSIPFDPEGILSTLPAIVNVVLGYVAGIFIQKKGKSFEGIAKLLMFGFALTSLALWWDLIFPISKKLWTSPFVLYTVGLDLSIMAVLIYFIELKKVKAGIAFFDVFGKNPLFIYLFSELFYIVLRLIPVGNGLDAFEWVSEKIFQNIVPGAFGSLLTALAFMLLCWLLGYALHKKRIYIKI